MGALLHLSQVNCGLESSSPPSRAPKYAPSISLRPPAAKESRPVRRLKEANTRPLVMEKRGVQGGEAPMPGGMGDVPPGKQNKGREGNSCNPATRGTLNPGKPSANEGGKKPGVQGAKPPGGGCPLPFSFFPPPFPATQPGFRGPLVDGFQEMPARPHSLFFRGHIPRTPWEGAIPPP